VNGQTASSCTPGTPGATDASCNGIDDNCNGQTDEDYQSLQTTCGVGVCASTGSTSCVNGNEEDSCIPGLPTLTFYQDSDGDGYGSSIIQELACTQPSGYVSNSDDCDDTNPAIHPGADEVCNGIDDNCDLQIDEGLTFDNDGDGYSTSDSCEGTKNDCNDAEAAINPGATEICDGFDNDCDGAIDEGCDDDSDTYIDGNMLQADGTPGTDCNDNNASVNPGVQLICPGDDGSKADCREAPLDCKDFCGDLDSDGYVVSFAELPWYKHIICPWVVGEGDCNDNDENIHPGATEICNGVDDNCNNIIDDPAVLDIDSDHDGYNSEGSCNNDNGIDCNDSNAAIHPGAAETCDGIDSNCNDILDGSENLTRQCGTSNIGACKLGIESCNDAGEWYGCTAIGPAPETCDGKDNDCDAQTDEDKNLKFTFNRVMVVGENVYANGNVYAADPLTHSVWVPLNAIFQTTPTEQPGLILDSAQTSFDVGLYGKDDKIPKEAVDAVIDLDGMNVHSIQNIQSAPYESIKRNNGVFGTAGRDQVDIVSPTQLHIITTVTTANDEFRTNFNKITCNSTSDQDHDGIADFIDRCPNSIPDTITPENLGKEKRFAQIDSDAFFEQKIMKSVKECKNITVGCGKKKHIEEVCHQTPSWTIVNSKYTLANTSGCTCYDILGVVKGDNKEQYKNGCNEKTITDWIKGIGSSITTAR